MSIVVVGAMLLIGLIVVGAIYDTSGQDELLNTTATVDYGNSTTLDAGEEVFEWDSTVTVTNSSGTVLTDGTDYDWYPGNHSVVWYNTSQTTDGESVTVEAGYTSPTDDAESALGNIAAGFDLGSILPIVLPAGAVLAYLMGNFGGSGEGRSRSGRR